MKFNDKAMCLLTSGLYAGFSTAITIVCVPCIKATSDPLPSFKRLYKNGSKFALSMVALTSGLAVKVFMKTEDSRYLLLAGTTLLVVPYFGLIKPTNDALFAIKDNKYREDEEEETNVRKLITKWDKIQYGRTALSLLAFALNIWIVCKKCKN